MDKKAEPEITVFEVVGERRFYCALKGEENLEINDLERLDNLFQYCEVTLKLARVYEEFASFLMNTAMDKEDPISNDLPLSEECLADRCGSVRRSVRPRMSER